MPPDFTLGIIQFRETLSQPPVIKAVRNIFPRAVLMVDTLKEEDLDRHIKVTKDLKHWNDDRFEWTNAATVVMSFLLAHSKRYIH